MNDMGKGTSNLLLLVIFAVSTLLLTACSSGNEVSTEDSAGKGQVVIVQHESFTPRDFTINVGDTVTWHNINDFVGLSYHQHTVASGTISIRGGVPDGLIRTELLKDEEFSYTFTKPGVYTFYLNEHPQYTGLGTITVR